ncbi:MAG: N4-gp56 family major capsid protein [Smithella sp.]|jgi:N4-gp56 family major capsid protein
MSNTISVDALRPEIWQKELYADVIDNLYFTKMGLMGKGDNNIVELKDDLKKQAGDTITVGLTAKLTGNGVSGDGELEGNEEAISAYSESVSIDQKRFAVRLTGRLDEKKNAYDMRKDAKNKLSMRLQEFIERQVFLKLGGVTNLLLTDHAGVTYSADATWSNTPDEIGNTDTAAGYGDRYLCADFGSGATSLATTDLLTPELISRCKVKAQLASPKILPLKIDGVNHYAMFIHPNQAYDLKNNAVFTQARREAEVRGKSNPIFTGALGIWDGVIIIEHEYVPFLDQSVGQDSFETGTSNTDYAVDAYRALLCGRQAAVFAKASNDNGWVEETFDYKNKTGFATGIIGGIQKLMFNSKEYGVIALDTYATALV